MLLPVHLLLSLADCWFEFTFSLINTLCFASAAWIMLRLQLHWLLGVMASQFYFSSLPLQSASGCCQLQLTVFNYNWLLSATAVVNCNWLLLTATGCCRLQLAVVDCNWLLLTATGCCWWQLAVVDDNWLLSTATGCCWLQLAVVDCNWLLSTATGCCRLQLAVVDCNWLLSTASGCCRLHLAVVSCRWLLSTATGCCQLKLAVVLWLFCCHYWRHWLLTRQTVEVSGGLLTLHIFQQFFGVLSL